jgi:hypothetical protein
MNSFFGLSKEEFQVNVKLRLLVPLLEEVTSREWKCICGETIDSLHAYHVLGCDKFNFLYTNRHDAVKKAVVKFLDAIGMKTGLATEVPLYHDGKTLITDVRYIAGGEKYVEVKVVNPAARRYLVYGSATIAEKAGGRALAEKTAKYAEHDETLIPKVRYFIVEATGRIIKESYEWIDEVAKTNAVAQTPEAAKKRARKHFLKSLSTQMAKSHTSMVRRFLETATLVAHI